MRACLLT